uniref:Vav 3 guanine nucleotide exchange factor b n=1 Tax=Gadus morhua TaxID=8049 RepID=A0A8C5CJC2_GADMO
MEYWRQCALWLISCKVLPVNHRVTADTAQVFDLAQTLRDGVLLCQLLNNLKPQTINLKEINLRPQMSQFMCLKNIRTFLTSCCEAFGMKKCDLFEAFDLFDVRDFGKVGSISENTPEDEEEQYAAVYRLEEDYDGGDIYEDLMRTEQQAPMPQQPEQDVRSCCLSEIKQTEEKYTETLESIEKYFLNPLKKFFSAAEIDKVFLNIPDLVKVHKSLMVDVQDSILNRNSLNLYQIFITYKERLLIYGIYCSQVEIAIAVLDLICKEKEDVRLKLEECAKRANNGKFTLRDLLVVPMQRVLKYHLLLQELVKHTHDTADKSNLRMALDAMKDLAQYVNEVKRDNETLREIDQYQRSIENLNQPLINYGRPKGDGEVRIVSNFDKRKQDRHIFLFDLAVIVCKRRGDNYDLKDVLYLNFYKITNNPTSDREGKKWCYGFYLTHNQGHTGFELFFKTMELKKKWLDQFEMAVSNIRPDNANSNSHQFKMHTFERITSCSFCHLLLRGIFNQGYLCNKCGLGAHKECLGRLVMCGRPGDNFCCWDIKCRCLCDGCLLGLPRMLVIRDYCGVPQPEQGSPLCMQAGDVVELISANPHISWWQVFAGPMERSQAEVELLNCENSTFLVRHRTKESAEYAISIKFNDEVKHIKILTKEGWFYIAETRLFKSLLDLVEYYKDHSLREGFRSLDTTLQVPYRSVGSSEVVNTAVARYDFSSRDTRELSLAEGDVVKIYFKMSNGWWRGDVDGRRTKTWPPIHYYENCSMAQGNIKERFASASWAPSHALVHDVPDA